VKTFSGSWQLFITEAKSKLIFFTFFGIKNRAGLTYVVIKIKIIRIKTKLFEQNTPHWPSIDSNFNKQSVNNVSGQSGMGKSVFPMRQNSIFELIITELSPSESHFVKCVRFLEHNSNANRQGSGKNNTKMRQKGLSRN
jgi:DNA replication protein DnaD